MKKIVRLLHRQAKRVMLGARYVIETDVFGNVKDVRVNRKPRVNVCAVIGPAVVWGEMECEEAVLLEIGLRHGRPYHRAALGERGAQKEFGARSKYDTVDLSFLKNVWETLEGTLCYDAGQSSLKRHGTFQRGNTTYLKGVSFSVSASDPVLFAAVIQSELRDRYNPLLEDMRRAGKWLEEKLEEYEHFAQMAKETPKPYETLLRLVRAGGKERKRKNFAENLFVAENFLFKRELLPHQWYLLNGAMACSTSFPVYSILSEQMPTFNRESIAKWGALLEMDVVPTFTSAYVWCKPETSIHKKRVHRKTAYATKRAPGNYLTFFLTPRVLTEKRFVPKGKHNILGHVTVPFPTQGFPF